MKTAVVKNRNVHRPVLVIYMWFNRDVEHSDTKAKVDTYVSITIVNHTYHHARSMARE